MDRRLMDQLLQYSILPSILQSFFSYSDQVPIFPQKSSIFPPSLPQSTRKRPSSLVQSTVSSPVVKEKKQKTIAPNPSFDLSQHLQFMEYDAPADSEATQTLNKLVEMALQPEGLYTWELVILEKRRQDQLFYCLNTWPKEEFPIASLIPYDKFTRDEVIEYLGTGPIEPQLVPKKIRVPLERLHKTKCGIRKRLAERKREEVKVKNDGQSTHATGLASFALTIQEQMEKLMAMPTSDQSTQSLVVAQKSRSPVEPTKKILEDTGPTHSHANICTPIRRSLT